MSRKIAVVREYDEVTDKRNVEEMERECDQSRKHGKPVMVSDLLGDPVRRVRHFPSHTMLVAEYGEGRKMVGVVRGCVKTVTRGNSKFVKLACVLGLRVSPSYRNLGIGTKLVQALEEWFKQQGATYAYMATDCTNEPSINLFTKKCCYVKFRTPTMLVQPVHAHTKPIGSDIAILRLTPKTAESIYTRIFKDSEFFPRDIDAILTSRNSLGTFIAVPNEKLSPKSNRLLDRDFPANFAILSVWSTKDVFRLQMKGVSRLTHAFCSGLRLLDSCMPWMKLPSFPNVFDKFWVYFMYGMHMEGKDSPRLMKSLCSFVHNIGRYDGGCGALAAELSPSDAVAFTVPHWKWLSWAQDLWCLKKLSDEPESSDWTRSRSSSSSMIFVDPRDI